jgi:hypothetical protein
MIKKRYGIPALVVGLVIVGGGTAQAFFRGPAGLDMAAFSSFTSDQQAAIQEAQTIRQDAEEEAQAVLDAAGISQDELRDALQAYGEKQHEALTAALEDNDYDAYKALIANSPDADALTTDIFAQLVEIHQLEEGGDREGAMELRKELTDSGFRGGFGGPGSHGPRPTEDAE